MAIIASDSIIVFPSINRSMNPKNSRLFTEYNLINLINQLTDTISFVITDVYNPSLQFEFNMNGYYFKVPVASSIVSLVAAPLVGDLIRAEISVNSDNELLGYDEETGYTGVIFTKVISEDDIVSKQVVDDVTVYQMAILKFTDDGWQVPDSSKIKFLSKSVLNIDGGEI